MTSIFYLISILLFLLMVACQNQVPAPVTTAPVVEKVTPPDPDSIRKDSLYKMNLREAMADSIRRARIINAAIVKIRSFRNKSSATFECDSFSFHKGHLVNSASLHILLSIPDQHRYFTTYSILELKEGSDPSWDWLLDVDSDIYTLGVLFKDVNGDGQQDFLVEGYGNGTGENYFNDVYLYDPQNHSFNFIEGLGRNPHFYPKEKIVTCYYNPAGAWDAEKYRLAGNKLELLEEITIDQIDFKKNKINGHREIYRYRNGERVLYKKDNVCAFPAEYKAYKELVRSAK